MKTLKRLLAFLVIAAVLALSYLNWDRIAPLLGIEGEAAADPVAVGLLPAPETLYRLVLLDVTTSTQASFKESIKSSLATAVAGYVPEQPTVTKEGVPGLAGLDLIVRLVGTKPLEYGAPHYEVTIPAISELPPRPDMTLDGALDPGGPYQQWTQAEDAWKTQYAAAQAAAASAAAGVQSINTALDEWSAVTAGAVALALLAPPDGDVQFLVASDLDDNQDDQAAGSFNGHAMVVVQPDPTGVAARADALFSNFSAWATAQGAGQITRVRPEVAESTIQDFVKGARS